MKKRVGIVGRYYRLRGALGRYSRLVFMSPAEARLLQLVGGRVITIGLLRHYKTKFPATIVLSRGKLFRQERMRREVRVGKYYIDFANDIGRGIEVDGAEYHTDVVAAFDRDSYLYQRGWQVMHIPALSLWREPAKAQQKVLEFFYK